MAVIETLFETALKLESPWKITKVDLNTEQGKITIRIDFPEGSLFRCPRCGREAKAYDTKEKVWRYLNFFQYECHLVVRVPRTDCKEDGALQVEVPWAKVSFPEKQKQCNGGASEVITGDRIDAENQFENGKGISLEEEFSGDIQGTYKGRV